MAANLRPKHLLQALLPKLDGVLSGSSLPVGVAADVLLLHAWNSDSSSAAAQRENRTLEHARPWSAQAEKARSLSRRSFGRPRVRPDGQSPHPARCERSAPEAIRALEATACGAGSCPPEASRRDHASAQARQMPRDSAKTFEKGLNERDRAKVFLLTQTARFCA